MEVSFNILGFILRILLWTTSQIGSAWAVTLYSSTGSTVVLICSHKPFKEQTLEWTRVDPTTVKYSQNDELNPNLNKSIKDRISITGDKYNREYYLTISNLSMTDKGKYECSITSRPTDIEKHTVNVIEPPSKVLIENKNFTNNRLLGIEGKDIEINCTAYGGDPAPDVSVLVPEKDKYEVSLESSSKFLLQNVDRSYDGQIVICSASNIPNRLQKNDSAEIYLQFKPLPPIFRIETLTVEEMKPFNVSCTSYGNRPAGTFIWSLGNTNLTDNSTQQSPIYNISTDTHTVTSTLSYRLNRIYNGHEIGCGVKNVATFNSVVMTYKVLDVKYAPDVNVSNVTYSQNDINRTIACIADGNPTTNISYSWQHLSNYGIVIRKWSNSQNGLLILPNVSVEKRYQDNGEYRCTASNGVTDMNGQVIKQTGIGSMIVNASPVFTMDNQITQFGVIGGNVELHINVYSIPKFTNPIWYKGNHTITSTAKYLISNKTGRVLDRFHAKDVFQEGYILLLTISNLTDDDFTDYMVELSNNIGSNVNYTISLEPFGQDQDTISLPKSAIIGGAAGGSVLVIVALIVVVICFNKYKDKSSVLTSCCLRHGKKMQVSREKLVRTSSVERSNEMNYISATYAEVIKTDKQKKKQKEKPQATESCCLKDNILYQSSESSSKAVPNVEYAQVLKKTNKPPSAVQRTGDGNNTAAVYAVVDKGGKQNKIMTTNKTALNNQTVDEYVNADLSLKLQEDDKNTDANNSDQGFHNRNDVEDDRTVYEKVENSAISGY